ncbi:NAD(P)(+) transhydrogenase (Re/Si-specific) subunit beta [Flammeovirgaceae bacterium SG7u.111]|nr:NAD(P)(+) transhydrogenase (Re/Si-specific) subunit beta [Flammeovirgaceae bacterium SG7u.132]WPO33103.1 NAD(P)(+) transhydrogenase (Re/Si-specific) subunit beta [Flammeovirgaceae bacterium SG7u.111]
MSDFYDILTEYAYLFSIVLFIAGLKKLSHPESAKKGNLIAAAGMGLGIVVSLITPIEGASNNYLWIVGGMLVGGAVGYIAAKRVKITKMPEMVSLFNGLGGACAMLISFVEINNMDTLASGQGAISLFALFIGSISFTGSLVAYGKLDGFLRDSLVLPAPQIINGVLLLGTIAFGIYLAMLPEVSLGLLIAFLGISLLYGFTFVTPIGGGDMPVVISLLNSFTGLGAAGAGLIYGNQVMLVGGILVGASGTILTVLMCKAMNRSLVSVVIGGFGSSGAAAAGGRDEVVKEARHADLAIQLKYAQKVMIVPGYGLAVAQAQHTCHELETMLEEEGVQVKFAIHPVAGRMPGHMNVLLAEADVSYTKLLELEEANKEMPTVDMVLVIGANDVVNPAAKEDPASPIYGMPILDVELAKNVTVLKRSMSAGYAGIQNQLFFGDKTKMLFGDAKASLQKLIEEVGNA